MIWYVWMDAVPPRPSRDMQYMLHHVLFSPLGASEAVDRQYNVNELSEHPSTFLSSRWKLSKVGLPRCQAPGVLSLETLNAYLIAEQANCYPPAVFRK